MVWIRFKAEGKNGPYYGKMDIILPEIYLEEEALNNAALEKARSLKVSEIKWLHHKITDEDAKVTEVRLAYKIVNGTYYDYRTSDDVIAVLENARMNGVRLKLHFGDAKTGQDWNEQWHCRGTIGRSTGPVKTPLIISTSRSIGGPAILTDSIVRIKVSGKNGRVLYQHPNYNANTFEIVPNTGMGKYTHQVKRNGKEFANFESESKARRFINDVTGVF